MPSIGVITLELRLENSHSLKDKRQVVKGLRDRLHNRVNVSVAEIDCGFVAAGGSSGGDRFLGQKVQAEKVLQSVEHETASLLGPALAGVTVEWM